MNSTNNPTVSVVMPVYNAERYLRASIDSILRQTYEDFELIIINDGSTDNSQAIIDHYSSIDQRIISMKQENKGVVVTANYGASLAKGKYIMRTDADDISFDNKLEDLINCAHAHARAIVISGNIEVINELGEFVYREIIPTENEELKRAMYLRNPLPNGATLIKKSFFDKVGGYDDVFAEDFHLWVKLFPYGDFVATGTPIYQWRLNMTGLTFTNNEKSIEKEREYANMLWSSCIPPYVNRSDIIARSKYYTSKFPRYGNEAKRVFLFDLVRLSIHLIKHRHITQGIRQLLAVFLSGRTGIKMTLERLHITTRGTVSAMLSGRHLPSSKVNSIGVIQNEK